MNDAAKEGAKHLRVEAFFGLKRRLDFAFLDDKRVYANTGEVALNDVEDAVSRGLIVFGSVEIFDVGTKFDEVVFQLGQFPVGVERTLLGDA